MRKQQIAAKCSMNFVIIRFDRSLSIKFTVEHNNLFCFFFIYVSLLLLILKMLDYLLKAGSHIIFLKGLITGVLSRWKRQNYAHNKDGECNSHLIYTRIDSPEDEICYFTPWNVTRNKAINFVFGKLFCNSEQPVRLIESLLFWIEKNIQNLIHLSLQQRRHYYTETLEDNNNQTGHLCKHMHYYGV